MPTTAAWRSCRCCGWSASRPAVLLVLIDGMPRVVHIEEPRAGVQYGVDEVEDGGVVQARVPLRDAPTAEKLPAPSRTPANPNPRPPSVAVPFRRGAPGVVHLAELARRIKNAPGTNVVSEFDAAEFGDEMLQFPWRAVFGDQTLADPNAAVLGLDDVFRPALGFDKLQVQFTRGVQP